MKTPINTVTLNEVEIEEQEQTNIAPNLGIGSEGLSNVGYGLHKVLANTYMLMLKSQNYHWNVRGPLFLSLHQMTEDAYNNLFETVDDLAERIRSLGHLVKGNIQEFEKLSAMSDTDITFSDEEMVKDLVEANELLARMCRFYEGVASDHRDAATADMLTQLSQDLEKQAWMYRSFLEK